jgi:hypothetical protein
MDRMKQTWRTDSDVHHGLHGTKPKDLNRPKRVSEDRTRRQDKNRSIDPRDK